MCGVAFASYVVNAMDRQLFPLLASDVRREYGFSLAGIGLLSTIFTLGMALAGLPTGLLLARFSRNAVLQAGIAIFSAGTALTVISSGFFDMLIYRAATGIGEAMQLTVLVAIAANYFAENRAAALGALNIAYAIGAALGPVLGGALLGRFGTWRLPMIVFASLGVLAIGLIRVVVRPWFSEGSSQSQEAAESGGAVSLWNRNTVLLTLMSVAGGLVIYGYLGMYPTFLREGLRYSPAAAGAVMGGFGLGALASLAGGWIGDRVSPRIVLGAAFFCAAGVGYLLFRGPPAMWSQLVLSFAWGSITSGTIFVNLAGYHVKAVRRALFDRAAGIFVTSLYGSAVGAGYLMGWIASHGSWAIAGEMQLSVLSIVAGGLALALQPDKMAL